jgi:hypothetical protein
MMMLMLMGVQPQLPCELCETLVSVTTFKDHMRLQHDIVIATVSLPGGPAT